MPGNSIVLNSSSSTENPEPDIYYRAYGGRSLAFASAEYSLPLTTVFRLAGFYDIGNVWMEAYELDPDNLASSAGVGVRFDIPGFLVVHQASDTVFLGKAFNQFLFMFVDPAF